MSEQTPIALIIADWADALRFEDLPADVVESIKSRVLDTLGIAVAASALDTSQAVQQYARDNGGTAQATALGVEPQVPASRAAFVNGVLAHSLDYDDTHLPSVLHPSASVVPAVLAYAQAKNLSGRDVIRAIAIGLEVCIRLGMAGYDRETQNSTYFEHGQHATSICGAMGSAAAVGALAGNASTIANALGVAASMASGIIECNRTGGTVKRIHCGWAAQSAVSAVELVELGLTGPPTVIEGRFGFLQAWLHGTFNTEEITRGLGTEWVVPDIFFKPYPANHFTHAAVDAAAAMRRAGIGPEDVAEFVLGVPAANIRTIGEPIEVKRRPETAYMAQFSGPYAVAAGLLGGGGLEVGLDDYTDELAKDPVRRAIMAKVSVVVDERCSDIFPMQFPAVLTARLHDGREIVEEVFVNRGGNQNPLSFDELTTKFRDNAVRILAENDVVALEQSCRALDTLSDIHSIFEPLGNIAAVPAV